MTKEKRNEGLDKYDMMYIKQINKKRYWMKYSLYDFKIGQFDVKNKTLTYNKC